MADQLGLYGLLAERLWFPGHVGLPRIKPCLVGKFYSSFLGYGDSLSVALINNMFKINCLYFILVMFSFLLHVRKIYNQTLNSVFID